MNLVWWSVVCSLEFCHVKRSRDNSMFPFVRARIKHTSSNPAATTRLISQTPNTKRELLRDRMGNANSQLLDNIVQGSNCIFVCFTTVKPALTYDFSRSWWSRKITEALHETGQGRYIYRDLCTMCSHFPRTTLAPSNATSFSRYHRFPRTHLQHAWSLSSTKMVEATLTSKNLSLALAHSVRRVIRKKNCGLPLRYMILIVMDTLAMASCLLCWRWWLEAIWKINNYNRWVTT